MNPAFERLISVNFVHDYFSDTVFRGLKVNPSPQTSEDLLRCGLLFKASAGTFDILFETFFDGVKRKKEDIFAKGLSLRFIVRLTDTGFFNYTNVRSDRPNCIFHFQNQKATSKEPVLHRSRYASGRDLVAWSDPGDQYSSKPFALVNLYLKPDSADNVFVRFKAKKTYWRYLLTGEYLQSLKNPAILDYKGGDSFEAPEKVVLNGKNFLAFRSKKQISLSQKKNPVFRLVDNYNAGSEKYNVVIGKLPNANPSANSFIGSGDTEKAKGDCSEISIY